MKKKPESDPQRPQNRPHQRYQVSKELERNKEGVCITYLAKDNATGQPVFLTRFVVPESASKQSDNDGYQQRIQLLRELNHPGIPRYLDSFQTPDGICLVQEYKQIVPITGIRTWSLEQIKQLAVCVLEILVYLQNQTPPIVHRNIKPGAIFADDKMNFYLMDFGFAQIGGGDMPLKRLVPQQRGFTSPEQIRDRPLSEASDLYSLGATLMCLLTGTDSTKINTLIGQDGGINVKGLVPINVSVGLVNWLETMLAPYPKQRYPNAIAALEAVKTIDVNRSPDVQFKPEVIDIKAKEFGEIISEGILVFNPVTDTVLSANWDVAPSPQEPRRSTGSHAWISFNPAKFEGNKTNCQISIDTRKLMANKTYERQILLHSNSAQKIHTLTIRIKTAAIKPQKILYVSLIGLFAIALIGGWIGAFAVGFTPEFTNWAILAIGLGVGGIGGWAAAFSKIDLLGKTVGLITGLSVLVGFLPVIGSDIDIIVGFFIGLVVVAVAGTVVKHHVEKKFSMKVAVCLSTLTAALGMSGGMELTMRSLNPLLMLGVLGTGLPLATMIVGPYLQYQKRLHNYQKSERSLIKP